MSKSEWKRDDISGESTSFLGQHVDERFLTAEGGINPNVYRDADLFNIRSISLAMGFTDPQYCRKIIEENTWGVFDSFRRIPTEHIGPDDVTVASGYLLATHTNTAICAGGRYRELSRQRKNAPLAPPWLVTSLNVSSRSS